MTSLASWSNKLEPDDSSQSVATLLRRCTRSDKRWTFELLKNFGGPKPPGSSIFKLVVTSHDYLEQNHAFLHQEVQVLQTYLDSSRSKCIIKTQGLKASKILNGKQKYLVICRHVHHEANLQVLSMVLFLHLFSLFRPITCFRFIPSHLPPNAGRLGISKHQISLWTSTSASLKSHFKDPGLAGGGPWYPPLT